MEKEGNNGAKKAIRQGNEVHVNVSNLIHKV